MTKANSKNKDDSANLMLSVSFSVPDGQDVMCQLSQRSILLIATILNSLKTVDNCSRDL